MFQKEEQAAFATYLGTQRRLAPLTLQAYLRDVEQFGHWLQQQGLTSWEGLEATHLRAFLADGAQRGLAPYTLRRRLAAVRIWLHYLVSVGLVPSNVALLIRGPKAGRSLPKILDPDEASALLDARSMVSDIPLLTRDWAMAELFYASGLRLAELASLDMIHMDSTERLCHVVHGKGGKERLVPYGTKAAEALDLYWPCRALWANPGEQAVFISIRGRRLGRRAIEQRLAALGERRGLLQRLHPHKLRHACASHLLQSGADLRSIQELLGHSQLATTEIYTHLDFQHLAAVYDQAHPRAKRRPDT
jgi:integrase/recombinase XerC